jgi:hypothetical protein
VCRRSLDPERARSVEVAITMKHRSAESIAGRYTIEAGQRSDKEREMEAPTASLSRRKYFVGLLAAAAASQENELKSRRPKAQRRVPAFFWWLDRQLQLQWQGRLMGYGCHWGPSCSTLVSPPVGWVSQLRLMVPKIGPRNFMLSATCAQGNPEICTVVCTLIRSHSSPAA